MSAVTAERKAEILQVVEQSLIDGMSAPQVAALAAKKFDVTERTIRTYISNVRAAWVEQAKDVIEGTALVPAISLALIRREQIYLQARQTGDLRSALAADQDRLRIIQACTENANDRVPKEDVLLFLQRVTDVITETVQDSETLALLRERFLALSVPGVGKQAHPPLVPPLREEPPDVG